MELIEAVFRELDRVLLWGALATLVMSTVLEAAQVLGYSRMGLPVLFGTFVTADRYRAMVLGYVLYATGGLVFAFLYAMIFESVDAGWWLPPVVGAIHGLFLLIVFLPLLPYIHPRMATEYDGPDALGRLEPPGAFGLHYGWATPLATIIAQTLFGIIMGLGYPG